MKKTVIALSFLVMVFAGYAQPGQSSAIKPIAVRNDRIAYLYGTKSSKKDGLVSKQNGDFLRFTGAASVEWTINNASAGMYEININYGLKPDSLAGRKISILFDKGSVSYDLVSTQGVFGAGTYERIPVRGSIRLERGEQTVTFKVPAFSEGHKPLDFRGIELIPVGAKKFIEKENEKARKSRASTEWLNKAGYGLMFHWTSQSVNSDGTIKPYAEAVEKFDLKSFVDMVVATGAKYILFTIGHVKPYCPAPLKSWEKYHPGYTTNRDLIGEMADALNAKDIRLMCYFPTPGVAKTFKVNTDEFTKINKEVFSEFGRRYGKKVAGYWFDSWYQSIETHPDFSFEAFFKTCKLGNPERIIALNSWIYPAVTEWQEYWAGETASPVEVPVAGTVSRGPGKGLRYQALLIMEPYWVQEKKTIAEPRFTAEQLSEYIKKCMDNGGAVTINLGIYQDGKVGEKALEIMKEVKKRIRK